MNKFSVIIPTMQKDTNILSMILKELSEEDCIGEIILIDNSQKGVNFDFNKLKVISPTENLYVNPAWNYGISISKYDYFCLMNDDILIPKGFCQEVLNFITQNPDCGLVGLDSEGMINDSESNFSQYPESSSVEFRKFINIRINQNPYWGSIIFGNKKNYYPIPEDILVYCGDDYLVYKNTINKKTNYSVINSNALHYGSLTVNDKKLNAIKRNDKKLYSQYDTKYTKQILQISNKKIIDSVDLNGLEKVFCIKNVKEKPYKLVNILGYKKLIKCMNTNIKFSVILPTYNRGFCIRNAITSLFNQSYKNFELIIVDDGSTDGTEHLLKEKYSIYFKKGIFKYKYINHNGVSYARNVGLKMAKSDWIVYLDSDNTMRKNFLKEFKSAIIANRKTKCFYAKVISNKKKVGKRFSYKALCQNNYIDIGVFVHNKSLIKKYGDFDTELKRLVDWDLILRYTKHHKPYFIEKVLLNYQSENNFPRITNTENFDVAKQRIMEKLAN